MDLFGDGAVAIASSKVTGDRAVGAGGIYAHSSVSVTIQNAVVSGNFAVDGGGLAILTTPNFHVTGGSFRGNYALAGGAIYVFNSTGSISGVTISGNAATNQGGGVFQSGAGMVTLQIAKVHANTAPDGPDVFGAFTFV